MGMSAPEVEELSDSEVDSSYLQDWIGKQWPDRPPLKLISYVQSLLAIPQEWQHLLPSSSISLEDLTATSLPTVDLRLFTAATSLFSPLHADRPASWHLAARGTPPLTIVQQMASNVRQAILNGARSVRDPRYQRGWLPLWAITYWEQVHVVYSVRADVKHAQSWLRAARNLTTPTLRIAIDSLDVYSKLFSLSWDECLLLERAGSPATARQLLPLLANAMLTGELVDMMLGWIAREAQRRSVEHAYVVESGALWHEVRKAEDDDYFADKSKVPQFMQQLIDTVESGSGKILFMPILYKQHFVLAEIDSRRATLTFGTIHLVN